MQRYIVRDGERIYLSWIDEQTLYKQECISVAENACSNYDVTEQFDEDVLVMIGEEILIEINENVGDIEYSVLEQWGAFDNNEEED